MVDAVSSGVSVVKDLVEFIPNLGNQLVSWRDLLKSNPGDLSSLSRDIQSTGDQLSILLSTFPADSEGSNECPLIHCKVTTMVRKIGDLGQLVMSLEKAAHKKRYKFYPSAFQKRLISVKESLASIEASIDSIYESLQSSTLLEPDLNRKTHNGRYRLVRNVAPVPFGVVLDFQTGSTTVEAKLKAAIFDDGESGPIAAIAAKGMGGVGKTCALCGIGNLPETEARFPGGVLFARIGAEAGKYRLIEAMAYMVQLSGGEKESIEIRKVECLEKAAYMAGQWFEDHVCLFLIDDLWCVGGITPSLIPHLKNLAQNRKSRIAFTTRDERLVCGTHVNFDLRPSRGTDAKRILLKCANMDAIPTDRLALDAFNEILETCNGLPLALAIAGSGVRSVASLRCRNNPEQAWQSYLSKKGTESLVSEGGTRGATNNIEDSVNLSLQLINDQFCVSSAHEKFAAFCVLQKQQPVPAEVVARLWNMDDSKTEKSLGWFETFSLAQVTSTFSGNRCTLSVAIHDLLLDISRKIAESRNVSHLFAQKLISSYIDSRLHEDSRVLYPVTDTSEGKTASDLAERKGLEDDLFWSSTFRESLLLVADDGYIFKNMVRLLLQSGWESDMTWLIFHAVWIVQQLTRNSHIQVGHDVQVVLQWLNGLSSKFSRDTLGHGKTCLKAIKQAARLTGDGGESEGESYTWSEMVWFQLYGRMALLAEVNIFAKAFVGSLMRSVPKPWAIASVGSLPSAASSLVHELKWKDEVVCSAIEDQPSICLVVDRKLCVLSFLEENGTWIHEELSNSLDGKTVTKDLIRCASFFDCSNGLVLGLETGAVILFRFDANEERHIHPKKSTRESARYGAWKEVLVGKDVSSVNCVAVLKNGSRIVSGFENGNVLLWEKHNLAYKQTLIAENEVGIIGVSMTSTGSRVAYTCLDESVNLCDEAEGRWSKLKVREEEHELKTVYISSDGRRLFWNFHREERNLFIWNEGKDGTWTRTKVGTIPDPLWSSTMSCDGRSVLSGSWLGHVTHWYEEESGRWIGEHIGDHRGGVHHVDVSEHGERIASRSAEVYIWEKRDGHWVSDVEGMHKQNVTSVSVSPDLRSAASVSFDGTVCIWKEKAGSWEYEVIDDCRNIFLDVALAQNGKRVFFLWPLIDARCRDWVLSVRDEVDGCWKDRITVKTHGDLIWSIAASGNGKKVVYGSRNGNIVICNEVSSGVWKSSVVALFELEITKVDITEDGHRILALGSDGGIRTWQEHRGGWEEMKVESQVFKNLYLEREKRGSNWWGNNDDGEYGSIFLEDDTMAQSLNFGHDGESIVYTSLLQSITMWLLVNMEWKWQEPVENTLNDPDGSENVLGKQHIEEISDAIESRKLYRIVDGFFARVSKSPFLIRVKWLREDTSR